MTGLDVGRVIAVVMAADLKAPTQTPTCRSIRAETETAPVSHDSNKPSPADTERRVLFTTYARAECTAAHPVRTAQPQLPTPSPILHLCPATSPNSERRPHRGGPTQRTEPGVVGWGARVRMGRVCTHRRRDYSR